MGIYEAESTPCWGLRRGRHRTRRRFPGNSAEAAAEGRGAQEARGGPRRARGAGPAGPEGPRGPAIRGRGGERIHRIPREGCSRPRKGVAADRAEPRGPRAAVRGDETGSPQGSREPQGTRAGPREASVRTREPRGGADRAGTRAGDGERGDRGEARGDT